MKDIIRAKILKKRAEISALENEEHSEKIFKYLKEIKEFCLADTIFCYVDFKNEIKTDKIIKYFDRDKVFLPYIKDDKMQVLPVLLGP